MRLFIFMLAYYGFSYIVKVQANLERLGHEPSRNHGPIPKRTN